MNGEHIALEVSKFYVPEYASQMDEIAKGTFTFFGQTVEFGNVRSIDWHHTIPAERDFHLWRMKLGHMGFICPMLLHGDERHLDAVDEIVSGFGPKADFGTSGCFSSYWFPYSVSHRILAVLSGYVLARRSRELPSILQKSIEEFLRYNAAFLMENIEHELKNNHVERNLAALCFYFTCVEVPPEDVVAMLDREVRKIVVDTILEDGMLAERSAMYQGLSVMALKVFSSTPFLSEQTRGITSELLGKAERAWEIMSHPDGNIALFNDSWWGEVPQVSEVLNSTPLHSIEVLKSAGYARIHSDDLFVLFDAGPIGPAWNPGHGHADFLSLELDIKGTRFIVDPGTFQYSTGARRAKERSAQSHNGPALVGFEPVEYYGCFKVGRLATAELDSLDNGQVEGRLRSGGTVFQRNISIVDAIFRAADRWSGNIHQASVTILVQGEWQLEGETSASLDFRLGSVRARLEVTQGQILEVTKSQWSRRYLHSEPAWEVKLVPSVEPSYAKLMWQVSHFHQTEE
jgi:hypothetical protein